MITNLFRIPVQRKPMERTALYRFWDAAGTLLYVGITNSPDLRWGQHAADKPWWGQVHYKEVCAWYPSRHAAERAERMAILCERPLYNIVHNLNNPHRVAYRHNAMPTYRPTLPWHVYVPWHLVYWLAAFLILLVITVTMGAPTAIGIAGAGMLAAGAVWPQRRRRRRRRRR